MKVLILIKIIICCSFLCYAQESIHIRRADAYFKIGQYNNAVKYYEMGHRKENTNYVCSQLANCYRKLNKPELSIFYLLKIRAKSNLTESQHLALCNAFKITGRYKDAKLEARRLAKKYPENDLYKSLIASCDSALYWLTFQKEGISIENLRKLNTEFSEISPFINQNELYFASNREEFIIRNRPGGSELPFYDLYASCIDSFGTTGKVRQMPSVINSATHESSIAFSATADKVFFTQHAINENDSMETHARLKIFYMENEKGKWKNPHTFIFNDSVSSFAHPYMTKDGKMFFFVSDMKGGLGGSDIYFCVLKDSLWSLPVNMGSPINSPGNEIFPFYDAENGKLYFSSDYHLGMGGFDIFVATENEGEFSIKNMQPPINSSYDDFGINFDAFNNSRGYFVSNRKGGKGLEDIYKVFFE